MNYKKLFWWHIGISAVWGFSIGIYRGIQQEKIKQRMANNPLLRSEGMVKAYNHYIDQARKLYGHEHKDDLDFPEWVNTDEDARFNSIVGRLNHPTNRQK
jgi:hypothetical protein